MLDGVERRLLLASFALLVGSFLVPLVARGGDPLVTSHLARADRVSDVVCEDPPAPREGDEPAEPNEEIAPEGAESDSPSIDAQAAATLFDVRLRLLAGVAPACTAEPREGDSLRRLTRTTTERGPPRA